MTSTFSFVTDTSTLVIFDVVAVRHRLDDDGDWWIIHEEALKEINAGNAAIIDLGADGKYTFAILSEGMLSKHPLCFDLSVPSGRVFIGAGEETTGDGLEPKAIRGGTILDLKPGEYRVSLVRSDVNSIALSIAERHLENSNAFTALPRL
jgi:hypothetical protein